MNYGYNLDTPGWIEGKKVILASRLVEELGLDGQWIPGGRKPYVEIDGLYPGVRIRKTTYLTEPERVILVRKADKIYKEVMRVRK